ncbi:diaminopimelate epimerase [Flavihumibacter petaseus]|uniref:Diaminopimelate epimerase n=1 Tax=Flavihumibacter petaseus NBRC 106054 TaxID=1220578 RepID=A0A0E9N1L8_9BACT|nr:diaminopimelate epimerase [Flavihumibacter petaseus]GAO43673.1 diaminopimelate epimerase [Flavihumibacter petaseus NBRC 106054]
MQLPFYKYQGTGNDFVILDNRAGQLQLSLSQIHYICDRRFGIGADGLMLLNQLPGFDFAMKYYNADGRESSMCGNGGRCLVKFAFHCGLARSTYKFIAADGPHEAEIDGHSIVRLKMQDVTAINQHNGDMVLDTGSPHYVKSVVNLMDYDVFHKGKEIRYHSEFQPGGINVNFVEQLSDDEIMVRTYERGVEDETLSCGTGVTASAIVNYHNELGFNEVIVTTRGGKLSVEFERMPDGSFTNVWLCGPAEKVFEGSITLPE